MSGDCLIHWYHEKNYHTLIREPNFPVHASDRESLFHKSTICNLSVNKVNENNFQFFVDINPDKVFGTRPNKISFRMRWCKFPCSYSWSASVFAFPDGS